MTFTAEECAQLNLEWSQFAKDYKVNGMCCFTTMFRKHPEYQKLFSSYAPKNWESLGGSIRLMCHASMIMKSIGQMVTLAGNDAGLTNYLHRMGGEHVCRNTGTEHFKTLFGIVIDQLVICNAGKLNRHLWVKFFEHCCAGMTEGLKTPITPGPAPSEEAIRDIFIVWDTDRDGALSDKELFDVMINLDEKQTIEKVRQTIAEADTNKDGKIQFDEFLAIFRTKRQ